MGFLSDRLGRRKPVIIGAGFGVLLCLAWILYARPGVIPPCVAGLATGVFSGAAMLFYTVRKEVNPPELGGTATGALNFQVFTWSAVLGAIFGQIMESTSGGGHIVLEHYQTTFQPVLYGMGLVHQIPDPVWPFFSSHGKWRTVQRAGTAWLS